MEERIILLLKKYIDRSISAEEVHELKVFINSSENNRTLVETFLQLHKTEMQADFISTIDKTEGWNRVAERLAARKRRRIALWAAAAAAVVVIAFSATWTFIGNTEKPELTMTAMMQTEAQNRAVITLAEGEGIEVDGEKATQLKDKNGKVVCENKNGRIVYYSHIPQPLYNKVSVKEGSTYQITLSDGTNITLASGSEIVYPIGGNRHDVKLKGEALFDVAHNEHSPFTVATENGTKVTVLGTKFNVRAKQGHPVTVTVETGCVGVNRSETTIYLGNNEQASFGNGIEPRVDKADAKLYTSWASGIYEFNDVPMSVIVHQLSLWYGVEFEFASARVKERKFTGALLRDEKLGYTLSLLKEVSNLKFSLDNNKIVIE